MAETEIQKLPELGVGSVDVSALHAALADGVDPQEAIDAARYLEPEPEPLVELTDKMTKGTLLTIAERENADVEKSMKADDIRTAILVNRDPRLAADLEAETRSTGMAPGQDPNPDAGTDTADEG